METEIEFIGARHLPWDTWIQSTSILSYCFKKHFNIILPYTAML